ncbi:hypothetical protein [Natrinema soli]|uniref:Uncharacterized protein n=1 Tax=Natrinema soli TaxID=1930624 RepID=A0ABD5SU07_9EURY|nr:hypothetical protein [Natrinema soli]
MDWGSAFEAVGGRVVGAIVGVTIVLTACLVGAMAMVGGDTIGVDNRFPYYVLVTAIGFVASLWKLDENDADGTTVLIATAGIALASGILFSFAVEGVVFGIRNPNRILSSQLLVYFLAAGLICTALGMWCLRHWREFTVYESA